MFSIKCINCKTAFSLSYTSDVTGNVRYYNCGKCESSHVAVWKGEPIKSCLNEPQNTEMKDWEWLEPGMIVILDERKIVNG